MAKGLTVKNNISSYPLLWAFAFVTIAGMPLYAQKAPHITSKKEVWITIFAHGIISIKPYLTIVNFMRFLNDTVQNSIYAQTINIMRDNDFFYQNQTLQERGLRAINRSIIKQGAAASAMANLYDDLMQMSSSTPVKNYYYTFGWSGVLSRSARYADSKRLFTELEQEVQRFRSAGIEPKIRIMGYSHGGTIALKLALIKQTENLHPNFSIDELYLLGTPIQFDTDYLINDPLFKKVYNIYSGGDRAQKLDFFSCGHFFSERAFRAHNDFTLPDKLVQIELRVIRKKGEARCAQPHPCIACPIYNGRICSRAFRNVSPGHTELWFFGWTPKFYRDTYPLYPIPTATFIPFIINSIKPFEESFKPSRPIVVTIDAYRDSLFVNNHICGSQILHLPFVGPQNFIQLKEKALLYKPDSLYFNKESYDEHIEQAYQTAVAIIKAKNCTVHSEHVIICE